MLGMGMSRLMVAPMMDWTDRHDRFFLRQISKHSLLYTEMVTATAIRFGDQQKLLGFSSAEHPLALQVGGSDPALMADAARIAEDYGYLEVNINVGCPSDRVQSGRFGACLMAEPDLVAQLVQTMSQATTLPITVKHRIGIDDLDSYEYLERFVRTVSSAGCQNFIVHARKAWLSGLSPKENREIPPLSYDTVYQLKRDFPHLYIGINGGITSLEQALFHLSRVDGVMIGREAYQNPYILALADQQIFGDTAPAPSRREILNAMIPYMEEMLLQGVYPSKITRHMLGLFQGKPGARAWKRYISEHAYVAGAGLEVVQNAMQLVPDSVLDERPSLAALSV